MKKCARALLADSAICVGIWLIYLQEFPFGNFDVTSALVGLLGFFAAMQLVAWCVSAYEFIRALFYSRKSKEISS